MRVVPITFFPPIPVNSSLAGGASPNLGDSFLSGPETQRWLQNFFGAHQLNPSRTAAAFLHGEGADPFPAPVIADLIALRNTIGTRPLTAALTSLAALSEDFWGESKTIREVSRAMNVGADIVWKPAETGLLFNPSDEPPEEPPNNSITTGATDSTNPKETPLGLLMDRYHHGDMTAVLEMATLAVCFVDFLTALHGIIAVNDFAFRHIMAKIEENPALMRDLLFSLRRLAGRVGDDIFEDEIRCLVEGKKLRPLSEAKIGAINRAIDGIPDEELGSWAAEGCEESAEELVTRYQLRSEDPSLGSPESARRELLAAVMTNDHVQELLLENAGADGERWFTIERLAVEFPEMAEKLAEKIEEGRMNEPLESLCNVAAKSPYAAILLCDVAKTFHDRGDFHRRNRVIAAILGLDIHRLGEMAKANRMAVDALVQLHLWGDGEAVLRQLELAAATSPHAREVLARITKRS